MIMRLFINNKYLAIYFIFFSLCSFGQEKMNIEKLFDSVEKEYNQRDNYSYDVIYSFYESETSTKPSEINKGVVLKMNGVKYQKIVNSEFIDYGDKNVMVDHTDKVVQVSSIENKQYPIIIKDYLKIFSTHKMSTEGSLYVCVLSNEQLNQTNIKAIKIFIDKNDFSIKKQQFIYFGDNQNEKVTIKNPKLEIIFSSRKLNNKRDQELVKKSNYFTLQNKSVILSNKYKTYKLIVY